MNRMVGRVRRASLVAVARLVLPSRLRIGPPRQPGREMCSGPTRGESSSKRVWGESNPGHDSGESAITNRYRLGDQAGLRSSLPLRVNRRSSLPSAFMT
jgi:hypothetical protein